MSQLARIKVLVADDHFLIRRSVRNTLEESKITDVQTAADGNEAIDLVQKARDAGRPYDVMDVTTDNGSNVVLYFDISSFFGRELE